MSRASGILQLDRHVAEILAVSLDLFAVWREDNARNVARGLQHRGAGLLSASISDSAQLARRVRHLPGAFELCRTIRPFSSERRAIEEQLRLLERRVDVHLDRPSFVPLPVPVRDG